MTRFLALHFFCWSINTRKHYILFSVLQQQRQAVQHLKSDIKSSLRSMFYNSVHSLTVPSGSVLYWTEMGRSFPNDPLDLSLPLKRTARPLKCSFSARALFFHLFSSPLLLKHDSQINCVASTPKTRWLAQRGSVCRSHSRTVSSRYVMKPTTFLATEHHSESTSKTAPDPF